MPDDKTVKINWKDLDKGWEEQYRKDYGHLFGNTSVRTEYP